MIVEEITNAVLSYQSSGRIPKYVLAPEAYLDPIKEEFALFDRRSVKPVKGYPPITIHGVRVIFSPEIKSVEVVRE